MLTDSFPRIHKATANYQQLTAGSPVVQVAGAGQVALCEGDNPDSLIAAGAHDTEVLAVLDLSHLC